MAETSEKRKAGWTFNYRVALALAATYLFFGSSPAAVSAAIKNLANLKKVALA